MKEEEDEPDLIDAVIAFRNRLKQEEMNNSKEQTGKEGKTVQQIEAERVYPNWRSEQNEERGYYGFLRGTHFQMEQFQEHFVTMAKQEQHIAKLKARSQRDNNLLKIQSDAINRLLAANNDLEAELKRKDEALLEIQDWQMNYVEIARTTKVYQIAEQALNPKTDEKDNS